MNTFINHDYITNLLESSKKATKSELNNILEKARLKKGLNHDEVSKLISTEDTEIMQEIYKISTQIKDEIYGNRIVLFAPLYISNFCVNNCSYCGYKRDNNFKRKKLSFSEIEEEVKVLEKLGHKRIALEIGEDPVNTDINYILDAIDFIYKASNIRRINVNIAATSVENYKKLKNKEIGTYILFQETYNEDAFNLHHKKSLKGDFKRQLLALDRAMEAGIDDVGGGVLFGLSDYKYEVISLLLHNEHLEKEFKVGFHTISVPRLQEALSVNTTDYKHLVSDEEFKKIIAILRIAIPSVGIILSTRESVKMRQELINLGVTQISAGSQTGVGSYKESEKLELENTKQFSTQDERSPLEVIKDLVKLGFLPSYCTACYRSNRTGFKFMEIVKNGKINFICKPNALITFAEYIEDYGDKELKEIGYNFIKNDLKSLDEKLKEKTEKIIHRIRNGERDIYV